ncbi:flavin reductase [Thermoflexus sp.]|uniref:flavin reductase n=1 Tax=Thermoflexus sp. TaxID=1969742 RepID=UPI0035E43C06
MPKVALDPEKHTWHPSVLPGPIVVVSTVDEGGEPNLAPKSWIMMAAFAGPVIAFGCNVEHTTYRNIAATGEFVINIPAEPLAERIYALIRSYGRERIQQSGFTLVPAQKVKPPIVQECRTHLECELESIKQYGNEVVIFGKIVAASIDAECLVGEPPEQYFSLRPIFFLEENTYGSIDTAKRVDREWPTAHKLFVVHVGRPPDRHVAPDLIQSHGAFLHALRVQGRLLMAGLFSDESSEGDTPFESTGMYVIGAASKEEAEELARQDPFVKAGASYTVRTWVRTF